MEVKRLLRCLVRGYRTQLLGFPSRLSHAREGLRFKSRNLPSVEKMLHSRDAASFDAGQILPAGREVASIIGPTFLFTSDDIVNSAHP